MRFSIILLLIFSVFSISSIKNTYAASASNMSNTQVAASTMEQDDVAPEDNAKAPVPKNPDAPKEAVEDFNEGVISFFVGAVVVVGMVALAVALF